MKVIAADGIIFLVEHLNKLYKILTFYNLI